MHKKEKKSRSKTPTFLLELPLSANPGQARRLRAHFEAWRCLYNALLGEAMSRLRRIRPDAAWQVARAIPRTHKSERSASAAHLRLFGLCPAELCQKARCTWLANHIDAVTAQTLATRAFRAVNRVCLGQAKRVRFRSRGRGLDSLEGKRNDTGLRFVLQPSQEGNLGWLLWGTDRIPALIDWGDPVVTYGLSHRIKYARLLRRRASGPKAHGADAQGERYSVQLALEGTPYQKPKNRPGTEVIGLDVGPSTLAVVPQHGKARLLLLCEELKPDARKKRRLERHLDRQRRASNPENYDERGRVKKHGTGRLGWKHSRGYQATRRRLAHHERKLAAHRKSLHGRLVNQMVAVGNDIRTEKLSYQGWQKRFGKSVGLRAPGMLIDHLKRTVANTGGTLHEFPTRTTKLSQYCHGCHTYTKKPLSQRWHHCACGIGPVQRDLYSACLVAFLDPPTIIPSIAHDEWEGAEARLRAAMERLHQRAQAGQVLPRSVGIPRAGARLPQSFAKSQQELVYRRGRREALAMAQEPPALEPGESQISKMQSR